MPSRRRKPSISSGLRERWSKELNRDDFAGFQRHAVGERVGEQENVAGVRVIIAHERFGAPQQVVVAVAEFRGDLRLKPEPDDVARAIGHVMHRIAHPQDEIVSGIELALLGRFDEAALAQFGEFPRAVFEERHPDQVLEIAQPTAAGFHVGLLQVDGVAEFLVTSPLVFHARGNVFVLVAFDATLDERLLK